MLGFGIKQDSVLALMDSSCYLRSALELIRSEVRNFSGCPSIQGAQLVELLGVGELDSCIHLLTSNYPKKFSRTVEGCAHEALMDILELLDFRCKIWQKAGCLCQGGAVTDESIPPLFLSEEVELSLGTWEFKSLNLANCPVCSAAFRITRWLEAVPSHLFVSFEGTRCQMVPPLEIEFQGSAYSFRGLVVYEEAHFYFSEDWTSEHPGTPYILMYANKQ